MLVTQDLTIERKLEILSDAAKYDVACTSSGVDRKGEKGTIGSASACGICHSFAADGRCISLLKILYTNECIFDCKYCINRSSNDVVRTSFTPDEVCMLTIEFYRRNYIEGLFLSSGILKSPNYTMELMRQALEKLRVEYRFNGYIHVKAIPGADPELIEKVGYLADRMSINLELPTAESLRRLAPHKNRKNILAPIRQIQNGIRADRLLSGDQLRALPDKERQLLTPNGITATKQRALTVRREQPHFVPAGQSTQMIIGATPESDYQIVSVAEALYKNYDLKRVFYSAYIPINEDKELPALGQKPPLLREHRLYQADWLLRFYGFQSTELLSEEKPNFNVFLDPKCDWAVRHLECFPVEINKADYYTLLRVPGIGVKSAQRIMKARRYAVLDFDDIKRLGVVLKRAVYFITCQGRMMYRIRLEENFITHNLIDNDKKKTWSIENDMTYRQLSLFDDFQMDSWEVVG